VAKARYWAVKNTTTMGCNARKTYKQTNLNDYTPVYADGGFSKSPLKNPQTHTAMGVTVS